MEPKLSVKILTVIGARPNFMKAAPIIAAIQDHNERLGAPLSDAACSIVFLPISTFQSLTCISALDRAPMQARPQKS